LFVKDPQEQFEEVLGAHPVPGFDRVIGYKQLRTQYRDFKKRRELLGEHDAFFCDDRILPMLPKLVGSTFSRPRQNPVPVRLGRVPVGDKAKGSKAKEDAAAGSLATALTRSRDCTWIRFLGQGSTFAVRTAHPYHTPEQVADNVTSVIAHTIKSVPGGVDNIQAIFLKSTSSVPLQLHASFSALSKTVFVHETARTSSTETFAAVASAIASGTAKPAKRSRSRAKSTPPAAAAAPAAAASSSSASSSAGSSSKGGKRTKPAPTLAGPAGGSASLRGAPTRTSNGAKKGGKTAVRAVREVLGGKMRAKPTGKKGGAAAAAAAAGGKKRRPRTKGK
jgi:ribosome biogenesis protein UTP30